MKQTTDPKFRVSIARSAEALKASQKLRYDVFVRELGGGGTMVDHAETIEKDQFDPFSDHMLLYDDAIGQVVGVYRLLRMDQSRRVGQFYSETEFDLTPLRQSGRRLLELGRSCLHADYRGGIAMFHLWNGLAEYVKQHEIEIMFGVASFHGTDIDTLAEPLSLLHNRHLAPPNLRVKAQNADYQRMDLIDETKLDRRKAMLQVPALIKAYLRLGGVVGEGAFVDHTFNTTDVCLFVDTAQMSQRQSRIYGGGVIS